MNGEGFRVQPVHSVPARAARITATTKYCLLPLAAAQVRTAGMSDARCTILVAT